MSTAPVTPTPAPSNPITTDIAWIRGHILAVLLAIALIGGSIIGGIALFQNMEEKHDARVAAAAQAQNAANVATQTAILNQLAQEHADNLARDAQQTTVINTLISQMSQQRAQTQKQVQTDATLDAKAAAGRLIAQTKSSSADVTVSNDTVSMTLPLTRIVVANLDQLTQAQSDVVNLQGQIDAQKILTSDAKVELATATGAITADKDVLVSRIDADNAACQVRVDAQASKDRKRGIWATIAGFVAGAVVRGLI